MYPRILVLIDGSPTFRQKGIAMAAGVLLAALLPASAAGADGRGALLYATHCIQCHTAQVHWRDQKLATDWNSLGWQVRRWQGVASLNWEDEAIEDVTRYLNDNYYRFEAPKTAGSVVPAGTAAGPAAQARR